MSSADTTLEREYNPRVQVPEYASYFARWKDSAQEVRRTLDARLDLRYGLLPAERLDYFPAAGSGNPLLIFVHGGYWRALDKNDFSWVAPPYVACGVSVAVINYGLLPGTPLLMIVEQVRRACAWLHHNHRALEIDPAQIVCSGHSAGGHLTAMMLATDWPGVWPEFPQRLLSGAVAISGLFDLEPLTRAEFLRNDLRLDPVLARALSPASVSSLTCLVAITCPCVTPSLTRNRSCFWRPEFCCRGESIRPSRPPALALKPVEFWVRR